ncbi:protein-glutamate methylesterase/protein-glutamine glutaminase [Candidatus Enterovibrio escicola]|uniref:protein-glutamate methylesterase/protein-glutamine glutaminase n=2 Tax=Candidatus Enterovibrio escicola TaxID=1927127 RepID=UPI001237F837|nr:chemotaxis response regulator protein-glutamate methylesterase [Candidatus Enterovibrio escacola]
MVVKVLVVDDSIFFRRRISEIINGDPRLQVIECAVNGKDAVEKVALLKPDIITMDIEMPVMDGITAVREIMKSNPRPILMFSSLTHDGAEATLNALDAGALDFLPKKFEDIALNRDDAATLLQQRIVEISRKRSFMRCRPDIVCSAMAVPLGTESSTRKQLNSISNGRASKFLSVGRYFEASGKRYRLVVIGTSTGGPVALQQVLNALPANFPIPIVLIQHMPSTFTGAFAQRLNGLCKISVKEAEDGDVLQAGIAYLAPGGMQMMIKGHHSTARIRIIEGGNRMNYKPSVDVTFGSAAKTYGDKVLSLVLTGMGADGREGARMLKEVGATVWAQDEESCVVYGMPHAVVKAGISTEDLPLDRVAERILVELNLV